MWQKDKGWGFITRDDGGKDVFMHIRDIENIDDFPKPPQHLQPVTFQIGIDALRKEERALNVQLERLRAESGKRSSSRKRSRSWSRSRKRSRSESCSRS